jgi:hypothetical protein
VAHVLRNLSLARRSAPFLKLDKIRRGGKKA